MHACYFLALEVINFDLEFCINIVKIWTGYLALYLLCIYVYDGFDCCVLCVSLLSEEAL